MSTLATQSGESNDGLIQQLINGYVQVEQARIASTLSTQPQQQQQSINQVPVDSNVSAPAQPGSGVFSVGGVSVSKNALIITGVVLAGIFIAKQVL